MRDDRLEVERELATHHNDETETYPLVESLFELGVKLATSSPGQYLLRKTDKFLWTIETTTKWSLPQQEDRSRRQG